MEIRKESGTVDRDNRQPRRPIFTEDRTPAHSAGKGWRFSEENPLHRSGTENIPEASGGTNRRDNVPSDPGLLEVILLCGEQASWIEIERAISVQQWHYRVLKDLTELQDVLEFPPKVFLIDVVFLPELGFLPHWLSLQGDVKPTLFFVSEYCGIELHIQAMSLGAKKLFVEPIDTNSLIKAIDACLRAKKELDYRLLLIEDESAGGRLTAEQLPLATCETKILRDPLLVFDAIWSFRPDAILMTGPHMAQVDPIVLTKLIREREESLAIPIVILSNDDNQETRLSYLQAGADDFLVAPKQFQYLMPTIACRIERAHLISHAGVRSLDDLPALLPDRNEMLSRLKQVPGDSKDGGWSHGMIVLTILPRMGGSMRRDIESTERHVLYFAEGLKPILQSRDCLANLGHGQMAILICRPNQSEVTRIVDLVFEIMNYRFGETKQEEIDYGVDVRMLNDGFEEVEQLLEQGTRAARDSCKQKSDQISVYEATQQSSKNRVKDGAEWAKEEFLKSLDSNPASFFENRFKCVNHWRQCVETIELIPHWKGLDSPVDFYRQAALCDCAAEFDRLVCENAIQRLHNYSLRGKSVRLILRQSESALYESGYIEAIKEELRRLQIVGNGLYLEFSLSAIATSLRQASTFFHELRALGIGISLSHFPCADSGFRALKYLQASIVRPRSSVIRHAPDAIDELVQRIHSLNAEIVLPNIESPEGMAMNWATKSDYIGQKLSLQLRKQGHPHNGLFSYYSRGTFSHFSL